MIGEYSFSKSLLYTEKLAGNVTACVGFVRDDRFYIPNTVLREDIRDITKRPQKRVLAVFKKEMKEPVYSELCYHAKGINLSRIPLPKTDETPLPYLILHLQDSPQKNFHLLQKKYHLHQKNHYLLQ